MISLENITVEFERNKKITKALKKVSLKVEKGDIYGIVGYSGAGKSTLVRCINLLQIPTTGKVFVGEDELTAMDDKKIRTIRKKIGMIFQHFNLMNARTVFENVYYPLRKLDIPKEEKIKRVKNLLEMVEISSKATAYPKELSGGQKQRVAIARALATQPDVLLCDEATSALDPKTTKSILDLLKKVNESLGITIVIITHEIQVVKAICNKCSLMQEGNIVETGDTIDIFTNPKNDITKEFIDVALHKLESVVKLKSAMPDKLLYILQFVGEVTYKPFMIEIYKKFAVETNILVADINYIQGVPLGSLIVRFDGEQIDSAIDYLNNNKIRTEVV